MEELDVITRLGVAIAIGLLVGFERGWQTRSKTGGARVAGIRTFSFMGLLGGLSGWLAGLLGGGFLGFAFLGFAILVAVGYRTTVREDEDFGMTTEIASLIVFALGAAAMLGDMVVSAIAGVAVTTLLAVKPYLHHWIDRVRQFELAAAIELAIISIVILPLLPNKDYGPYEALNPYELWWAVVLVAGLSFFAYVAIRVVGVRLGIVLAGLAGGFASSTATTLSLSRMARQERALTKLLAFGICLAGSVTFLRMIIEVWAFNRSMAMNLVFPLGIMTVVGLTGALVLRALGSSQEKSELDLSTIGKPLQLGTALIFGVLLTIVAIAIPYFKDSFGTMGLYGVAAVSGLTDVDAVTISIARMDSENLMESDAVGAIITAAAVNTAVKCGIAFFVGGAGVGIRVSAVFLITLLAGIGAVLAM